MPKQRKKRKRGNAGGKPAWPKKARKLFWVQQQCSLPEPATSETRNSDFEVTLLISSIHLNDDYRLQPNSLANDKDTKQRGDGEKNGGVASIAGSNETNKKQFPALSVPPSLTEKNDSSGNQKEEDGEKPRAQIAAPNVDRSEKLPLEQSDEKATTSNDADGSGKVKDKDDRAEKKELLQPSVKIIRHPSSFREPRGKPAFVKDLPNGDCGDGILNPYPRKLVDDKYWAQRRRLFTRFDDGIQLDKEGWFSVTPEAIANHIASRMVAGSKSGLVVLDAFAGVGGNAIAFALRPEVSMVICVDTDRARLLLAASNAKVYGIAPEKIVFIHDDACNVIKRFKAGVLMPCSGTDNDNIVGAISDRKQSTDKQVLDEDKIYGYRMAGMELLPDRLDAIFLSPPWGGVDYEKIGPSHYELSCIQISDNVDGQNLLSMAAEATGGRLAYFLPRNVYGILLGQAAYASAKLSNLELEQNYLNAKLKTVTLYAMDCVQECPLVMENPFFF